MKDNFQSLFASIRSKPLWILLGLIIVGLLISVIRVPVFSNDQSSSSLNFEIKDLPAQLSSSYLRMWIAYIFALLFSATIGTLAATNEVRAKFLIPMLDILQSVPVLGFFPTAIAWFMSGSSDEQFSIELAAIFLIFTSQTWNLAFGVYDGIKSIPSETLYSMKSLGLGPLALFRRLYLPSVLPRIVDNSVVSWANGWYFLMACEIISLGPREFRLPGLGSFMHFAIENHDWTKLFVGLASLVSLILLQDFLLWKPLGVFADNYRFNESKSETTISHSGHKILNSYKNARIFTPIHFVLDSFYRLWMQIEKFLEKPTEKGVSPSPLWSWFNRASLAILWGVLIAGAIYATLALIEAFVPPYEVAPWKIGLAVLVSTARILLAYVVCLAWIIPLVYFVNQHPSISRTFSSLAQVFASIPAAALFPLISIIALNVFHQKELAVLLLLLTGMQWYLLFGALSGANSLPNEIKESAIALGVKKKLYLKRVFIPSMLPTLVTASITAIGGGWNALIVSEYFIFDGNVNKVFGVGSLLAQATYETGSEKLMTLSLFFMVTFILAVNRFFWQRLYRSIHQRYKLDA